MRTIDEDGIDVVDPDLEAGRLVPESLLVAHHDAVPERERIERIDYDNPVEVYPNGGKIVNIIVEQEFAPAIEAWDEYEDVMRYVAYTQAELESIAAEKAAADAAREAAEEAARKAAEKAAAREAFLQGAPERVEATEQGVVDAQDAAAELGVMAAAGAQSMDEVMAAVAELGALVASTMTGE